MKPEPSSPIDIKKALRELISDGITLAGLIGATSVVVDNLPIDHGVSDVSQARAAKSILPMIEALEQYAEALLTKIEQLEKVAT
jgi:hypothetical protein